jgi:quinol monooxygenase YgiN
MPAPVSHHVEAYVVKTEWRAKPGAADRVAEICEELTGPSRREPGNLFFQTLRSSADPWLFYLYKEYVDEAGYREHLRSEHFTRLVTREAMPGLLQADACERFEAAARLVDLSPAKPHVSRASRRMIGTAVVLDLSPVDDCTQIDTAILNRAEARLHARGEDIRPRDILLLHTGWTERANGSPRRSPSLTQDAALWIVVHRPSCLGCDFFETHAPVQRQIVETGIALVDGLVNLAALPARCEFFARAPARASAWAWEAA